MILTLEITGPQTTKVGGANRKVFHEAGGTIGRAPGNDWVLPDRYVSSRHAVIRYVDGVYYIEDTSTNGVFINSPQNQLVGGHPYALKSGDWIFIDPYEIRVSITSEQKVAAASPLGDLFEVRPPGAASVSRDPFSVGDPFAQPSPALKPPMPPRPSELGGPAEALPGEEVDPLGLLGFEASRPAAPLVPKAVDLGANSVLSEHYQAPAPVPAAWAAAPPSNAALIPEDYNPLLSDDHPVMPPSASPPTPRPAPGPPRATPVSARSPVETPPPAPAVPVRPRSTAPTAADVKPLTPRPISPAPAAAPSRETSPSADIAASSKGGDTDLAAVLAGAGLDRVAVTPELLRSFGQILRVVVSGVMDVLQARQRLKGEFRMDMTTFKRADNNPLKFSANVDDALHNLLVKRNAAYLGPVDAFEDAFNDLRNHQMAMLAGMRVAFEEMLAGFDPDRLQKQFDGEIKKGGALLSVPAKFRYWDLYRDRFHDMVKDPDASFRELFGDEFARAYEEQLDRLKNQGRDGKR
jgi:type VI secretion system FHA domain protein